MAINFPSTTGQPTDGTYTHTVGNITWLWDGISWRSGISASVNESDPVFTSSVAGSISSTHVANWNEAYQWGDHSQAGYLTTFGASVTASDDPPVSSNDGDLWWESDTGYLKILYSGVWVDAVPSASSLANSGAISLTSLSVTTATAGSPALSYDNTTGVFTYTPPIVPAALTNIVDAGYGVNVTGKAALTDGIDIDHGGSINAELCTLDFTNCTVNFSGSTIGGMSSLIRDNVDAHLNTTNANASEILSWNGTDYDWVAQNQVSYGDSDVDTHLNVGTASSGDFLKWNGTDYEWATQSSAAESDTLDTVTGRGATTTNALSVGGISIGDDDGTKTTSLKIGDDADLTLSYDGTTGVQVSFVESNALIIRTKTTPNEEYLTCLEGGPVELYYDGSKKLSTSADGISVVGSVTDNKGELRTLPMSSHTADYTLTASDAGSVISIDGASGPVSITIPVNVFTAGQMITILNNGGQDVNIVQGTSTTVRYTDTGNAGNRTMDTYSSATILVKDSNLMFVSGTRFK